MSNLWFWLASGAYLPTTLVRLTLLLAVLWLGDRAWRRWNPQLRILLWRAGACAIVAVVGISAAPLRLPLLPAAATTTAVSGVEAVAQVEVDEAMRVSANADAQSTGPTLAPLEDLPPDRPVPAGYGVEDTDASFTLGAMTPTESAGRMSSWLFALGAVWLLGLATYCLTWRLGARKLDRLFQDAYELPQEIDDLARTIAASQGYAGEIAIRHSAAIASALSFGAWRPRILIPSHLCHDSHRQELRASLAHELAHVVHRDLVWNQFLAVLQACLWIHPLAWRMRLSHADACDELCDAQAACQLGDSVLYGRLLARIAVRVFDERPAVALAMAGRSRVRQRIEAVGRNAGIAPLRRWQSVAFAIGAAIFVIALGVGDVSQAPAQSPEQTPTETAQSIAEPKTAGVSEPGAKIQLYSYASFDSEPTLQEETVADSGGLFQLKTPPRDDQEGVDVVVATKPGYASTIYLLRGADHSQLKLPLKGKTASLSGVITDGAGQPVANALVTTQSLHPIPGVKSSVTDKNGRYSIDDLAPWSVEETRTFDAKTGTGTMVVECNAWVLHPDFPRTQIGYKGVPQKVDVQLLPPAIVEGAVVDLASGANLPGVKVQAQGIAEGGWVTTTTDAEGKYQLRLTNDHYNIWAVADDRMPLALKAVNAVQGERLTGMDIRMARGGYVRGTVVDGKSGRPIDGTESNLRVAHYGPARPKTGAAVTSALVGSDGKYRLHVAPGRNYIYLMSGRGTPAYVEVGEGQTVEHDLADNDTRPQPLAEDADEVLGRQIREAASRSQKRERKPAKRTPEGATLRRATPAGALLTELADMNAGPDRFSDRWAQQLRKIANLGPDSVPELADELDRTNDDMMIRSLAFVLRAIGDRRAVPALIRSIPKTARPSGSDMGLQIRGTDEPLLRFMQQHDLASSNMENEYGLGRPVREVFGALEELTGQEFDEQQLYSVFLHDGDLPGQRHAKRALFQRVAEQWATWWREHGGELVDDAAYLKVELPTLAAPESVSEVPADAMLRTDSGTSNWMLESIKRRPQGRVFYDLDTGRADALPKRWRDKELTPEIINEIQEWAIHQEYDLMGDEMTPAGGESVFVLRPLGLRSWELPKDRWKASIKNVSIASLQAEGRRNDHDVLACTESDSGKLALEEPATFFYLTRQGTPGILYLGIQVQDDSLQPGGVTTGDNELDPVAFQKGRRFGISYLVPAN